MKFKGKPAKTPHGAIALLWRNIIRDCNLEPTLGYLVTLYITKNSGGSKNLGRKTRTTLEADITTPEMSWKKFTHLVFNYLRVVRLDVSIKLTYSNGTTSTHTMAMQSNNASPQNESEDECTQKKK